MLIYAVMTGAIDDLRACRESGARDVLASYVIFNHSEKAKARWLARFRDANVRSLFMDSGAFSAHTRGIRIDLRDYYALIEHFRPTRYAALDVIGNPEATRRNLRQMEEDGFHPVPVFTRGAPLSDLEDLLERGYTDIAIGNLVGRQSREHKASVLRCLADVFATLSKRDQRDVRIHGFGVTSVELLLRFPFYSVDSSTGMMSGGLGTEYRLRGFRLKGRNVSRDEQGARSRPELTHHSGVSLGEARMRRMINNMRETQMLAQRVTKMWEARGVEWGTVDDEDWTSNPPSFNSSYRQRSPQRYLRPDVRVVGCGKQKADRPMPARRLYTGGLTSIRLQLCEALGRVLIFSAKYGIVEPEEVLEPYDQTYDLSRESHSKRAALSRRVAAKIDSLGMEKIVIELHAGETYWAVMADAVEIATTQITITRPPFIPAGTSQGAMRALYRKELTRIVGPRRPHRVR